ncbi:hypothetical protein [Yoonia sp.]|uniref:hypothetical protein n=1 Tax=Yoonia sp. TaxID=2212373 RepID=UPI0025CBDB99|nr:hypothetical protein [Yoonia sp.]MDC1399528.1 hypothetical protein [Yoonia sp.]
METPDRWFPCPARGAMVALMRFTLICCLALCGCASFPQLEETISDAARAAPYPALTPVPLAPEATDNAAVDLQARVAALQAKAVRIRQIDIAALQ